MIITICGSIKFFAEMVRAQSELVSLGHTVLIPHEAEGVDYWVADNASRVAAKKKFCFIEEHFDKIQQSDAVLIVNVTKGDVVNYIGANTFLEMGYAFYLGKKVYLLNPMPDQTYIVDELMTFDPVVLNGDLHAIS